MKRTVAQYFAAFAFVVLPLFAREQVAAESRVDFRYALPWWQSAVCLPDDPDKAVVGKEGQVLLDWGGGGFRGLRICLQPEIVGGAKWVRQQTDLAAGTVMQTWKDAAGVEVFEETFVVTPKPGEAQVPADTTRRIVVLITLRNTTGAEAVRQSALRIQSADSGAIFREGCSRHGGPADTNRRFRRHRATRGQVEHRLHAALAPVTLAAGTSQQVALTIERHCGNLHGPSPPPRPALRDAARRWWETSNLPFETIRIPDAGIQAMIESCVRNIWQAREIKGGKPAFHMGPTCYRGLWIVDGTFLLESAAILNRAQDARAGVEYMLSHQKPDGSFEILPRFWKENGIVLWAATRHALLTQDKDWLRSQWPAHPAYGQSDPANCEPRPRRIRRLPDYGLLPGGYIDGGMETTGILAEYSNTEWCLTGLKAAIAAAHWLGDQQTRGMAKGI